MSGPLAMYQNKMSNAPHTATTINSNGVFQGLVYHGTASTTTLQKEFSTQKEAIAHAQVFADELNAADAKANK